MYVLLAVHPRVCGEQSISSVLLVTIHGSSPRVRGTASARLSTHLYRRFIPACAGNSERWQRLFSTMAVHPRVCGEQGRWGVWGDASPRFIPACAGNSSTSRSETRAPAVHPRVCGEQLSSLDRLTSHLGSSPRVRGTGIGRACDHFDRRFIPACAGNSADTDVNTILLPVHPRVCGEQILTSVDCDAVYGSSPRVRGTDLLGNGCEPYTRFIPACAGNRKKSRARRSTTTVHPRVCGEQIPRKYTQRRDDGSSPRVRGTDNA